MKQFLNFCDKLFSAVQHDSGEDPLYVQYHDTEWGVPVHEDRRIFEFLVLESFQAGLSWLTILRKRENFRDSFAQFDPERVARFGAREQARLLRNKGIVRNRLKIEAAIRNARAFLQVQEEYGSFDRYIWGFTNFKTIRAKDPPRRETLPSTSPEATALAKVPRIFLSGAHCCVCPYAGHRDGGRPCGGVL